MLINTAIVMAMNIDQMWGGGGGSIHYNLTINWKEYINSHEGGSIHYN